MLQIATLLVFGFLLASPCVSHEPGAIKIPVHETRQARDR
jgi:hypothetical protein